MENEMNNRRAFMKAGVGVAATAGVASAKKALPLKKVVHHLDRGGQKPAKKPLFNQAVSYGNLLFIAGKGYHKEGDIKCTPRMYWIKFKLNWKMPARSLTKGCNAPCF